MPARLSWTLSHRVTESDAVKVTGHDAGHYDESTDVSLGRDSSGLDIPCFVTVSAPDQGGPENMIGRRCPPRSKAVVRKLARDLGDP